MYLIGDFQEPESTARAIQDLKTGGFAAADLDVFSAEPLEFPRGVLDYSSRMSLASVVGAILSLLLTTGFVYFTQYNYSLITGGMPIFSFWATGVIFYELTLLGGIVITFLWFLRESGLLRRGRRAPVPAVQPGIICVRVRCRSDQADHAGASLRRGGASNVRQIGEAA